MVPTELLDQATNQHHEKLVTERPILRDASMLFNIVPFNMPCFVKSTCEAANLLSRWFVTNIWPRASNLKRLEQCQGSFAVLICFDSVIDEQSPFGAAKAWITVLDWTLFVMWRWSHVNLSEWGKARVKQCPLHMYLQALVPSNTHHLLFMAENFSYSPYLYLPNGHNILVMPRNGTVICHGRQLPCRAPTLWPIVTITTTNWGKNSFTARHILFIDNSEKRTAAESFNVRNPSVHRSRNKLTPCTQSPFCWVYLIHHYRCLTICNRSLAVHTRVILVCPPAWLRKAVF